MSGKVISTDIVYTDAIPKPGEAKPDAVRGRK